ncbi:MAG: hypothetical protein HYX96_04060 [Chloroflexi bacterium]|nr:hypothetical protein [Chloroflexota bacterium]
MGAVIISLAGLGMVVYAAAFIFFSLTRLIEIGLSAAELNRTSEQIQAFSPEVYNYINHVQVNLGAFIASAGLAVAALGWFGLRKGSAWSWWTITAMVAVWGMIGIPVHYPYGFGTLEHLGLPYLALVSIGVGLFLTRPRKGPR